MPTSMESVTSDAGKAGWLCVDAGPRRNCCRSIRKEAVLCLYCHVSAFLRAGSVYRQNGERRLQLARRLLLIV